MKCVSCQLREVACAVLIILQVSTVAWSQPGNKNQQRQQILRAAGVITAEAADQGGFLVLPTPPRQLRRALSAAQEALDEQRYADAVESLMEVLNGGQTGDFFLPTGGDDKRQTSLRAAALKLLGSMPPPAPELYELQMGSDAQRLLADAIASSDIDAVMEVSRRYFHTKAGYEATMLLGRYDLDHNCPVSAALSFQRMLDAPHAAARFQPELSLLLAASWQLAGYPDRALQVLRRSETQLADATVTLAGASARLPRVADEMHSWLTAALGAAFPTGKLDVAEWTISGGNSSRTAAMAGGMPLTKLEWALESAVWPTDELTVSQLQQQFLDHDIAALPSLQPLTVGDYVLIRTARMMFAVDLQSGKRIWPYPWDGTEESDTAEDDQGQASVRRQTLLKQRMWEDTPYGQMSSDGEYLYLLRDLDAMSTKNASAEILMLGGRKIAQRPKTPRNYNRLVALELATEGKTKWTVGGQDSQVPELSDAFFLGPPLPLAGQLYALAEIKDEIKLLVLDSATGRLEWSQQLAQLETPFTILFDATRRLGGASPSFADGILICPTSSGTVVALDLATRSLRWAYRYARDNTEGGSRQRQFFNMPHAMPGMPRIGKRWSDSTARIVDGHVLLTPIESNYLHCLDLYSGQHKWRSVKRGNSLYVACVHDGIIVLVGENQLNGIRLVDGKRAWRRPTNLPDGAMPSGRGFHTGEYYYLPATNAQLHKIEIASGQIVESLKTEQTLGNLVCYQDYLISQGADAVYAFSLRDRKRSIVARRMQEDPANPDTLEDFANLMFGDGQWDAALQTMRRAIELHTRADRVVAAQAALRRMIVEMLRADFATYRQLMEEALELCESPAERREIALLQARGLKQNGEYEPAFQAYLRLLKAPDLAEAASDEQSRRLRHSTGGWRTREDVWLGHEINELISLAMEDQKREIEAAISGYFSNVLQQGDIDQLRVCLRYFPKHGRAAEAQLQLAGLEAADGHVLEAEFLLLSAEATPDPQLAAAALAARAELYEEAAKPTPALAAYQRLVAQWPDEPLPDGSTGRQRYAAFRERYPGGVHRWPTGDVETRLLTYDRSRRYKQWLPITVSGTSDGWPEGTTLTVDRQQRRLLMVDSLGRRTIFGQLENVNWNYFTTAHARVHGHLLVVSFGTHLVALDLLRAGAGNTVLWQSQNWAPFSEDNVFRLRFRAVHRDIPFAPIQPRRIEADGQMLAQLASLSQLGVCYVRQGDLYCLDPLTGESRWLHRDLDKDTAVWGDEELVFVSRSDSGDTRVFDVWDGHEYPSTKVPTPNRHWLVRGRFILTWDGNHRTGRGLQVRLFDPWTRRDVWTRTRIPARTLGCLVDQDALALLDPDGGLVIIRLADGQPLLETQIAVGTRLQDLQVLRSTDQYIVVVNHDDESRITKLREQGIQVHIPASGSNYRPRITGTIHAFDRHTGQPAWDEPAKIEQYGISLGVPSDVPILVFVRHVTRRQKDQKKGTVTNKAQSSLVCLDRRDGRILYENHELPMRALSYFIEVQPEKNTVEVLVPQTHHVHMTFTDQPRPVAPVGRLPAVTLAKQKPDPDQLPRDDELDELFK